MPKKLPYPDESMPPYPAAPPPWVEPDRVGRNPFNDGSTHTNEGEALPAVPDPHPRPAD